MSKSDWNLQVNTRAGYIDTEGSEELLRHHVNFDGDDGEILLPTQFNGKSEKKAIQLNDAPDDSEILYPIGINPE